MDSFLRLIVFLSFHFFYGPEIIVSHLLIILIFVSIAYVKYFDFLGFDLSIL